MNRHTLLALFSIGLLLAPKKSTAEDKAGLDTGSRPKISIRFARKLENPRPDGLGGNNSYLLKGMPKDAPNVAATFAAGYYSKCTEGFYDANLELVDSWQEPFADGDMIMCVTTGDLDGDGRNEIVLTTRKKASGVHALRWNPKTRKLETMWSFVKTPTVRTKPYFRGTAVGNFTRHEGREVCFGGDDTGLYLLDQHGKLIRHDRAIRKTIQRIDIHDNDGDGFDEMIVATGRNPGLVHYARWTPSGEKLEVAWSANVTPGGRGGNNCYEALCHPNGHPDGGPAIAVNTERESPFESRAGSILLLDMKGRELWHYVYNEDEERGGACDFADITGDGVPEIISRYSRELKERESWASSSWTIAAGNSPRFRTSRPVRPALTSFAPTGRAPSPFISWPNTTSMRSTSTHNRSGRRTRCPRRHLGPGSPEQPAGF